MLVETSADGALSLAGFDYEVSAQSRIEAAVAAPGRVLVPGRLLAEIVRSLPPQPVDISVEGAEMVLRCGSAEFGLLTMPVEDYPALPEPCGRQPAPSPATSSPPPSPR